MIKHYINYIDNTYYVEVDDTIVLSISLDKLNDQIMINTPHSEFHGKAEEVEIIQSPNDSK